MESNNTTTIEEVQQSSDTQPVSSNTAIAADEEEQQQRLLPVVNNNNETMTATATTTSDDVANSSNTTSNNNNVRMGTISSARFNMWSTMVGGGCLSLPLAFYKSGNIFIGPILLIITAILTQFNFYCLISCCNMLSPPSPNLNNNNNNNNSSRGTNTYESIASAAFGIYAYKFCTILVTLMCFFGIVGYAVLLRDMLQPITDMIYSNINRTSEKPTTYHDNITMFTVVLLVTPLCTLQTLTSLEKFGALSMISILILGICILYRSIQCTTGLIEQYHDNDNDNSHSQHAFNLLPNTMKDILDVIPLYISCYVCHYNIPVVHNELQQPTTKRVTKWLQTTVYGSTIFYCILGIAGSAYIPCSSNNIIEGNILLNFPENDPLVLVGRLCLAVTITLAFPMLTIPARDILLRTIQNYYNTKSTTNTTTTTTAITTTTTSTETITTEDNNNNNNTLEQPLLENAQNIEPIEQDNTNTMNDNDNNNDNSTQDDAVAQQTDEEQQQQQQQSEEESDIVVAPENGETTTTTAIMTTTTTTTSSSDYNNNNNNNNNASTSTTSTSFISRLLSAIIIFWLGAIVASCVTSIDIVWDLLGSSLSILLSYIIPCSSFLVISNKNYNNNNNNNISILSKLFAWIIIIIFIPLMFISTANAIYDTFLK